ncbi:hypothetical protein EMCRGX_G034576 [Ephydatia muelleri]
MVSTAVARTVLRDVDFPGDHDPTYVLAVSGKVSRRTALTQGGKAGRIAAALELQRIWRGRKTRRKLVAIISGLTFQRQRKEHQSRFPHVYAHFRHFRDYCARTIQRWWREVEKSHLAKKHRPHWSLQEAVVIIQRAWRRRRDMKLYRFYRDLIVFRARGNPSHLLRTINPLEAELLDKAAGSFVRFRLGGNTFPPSIYYKIFTHHNVVDMCAYSPRDYTAMANRWPVARDLHNKNPRMVEDGGRGSWYQRRENNGWRPVSVRLFEPAYDAVITEDPSKLKAFHHSKLQRREDLKRRQKQRKLEWLKKMYRDGSLQAKAGLDATADRAMDATQVCKADTVDDVDDVDELLSWSSRLDFEEYLTDWSLCATSAYSDDAVHVDERLA